MISVAAMKGIIFGNNSGGFTKILHPKLDISKGLYYNTLVFYNISCEVARTINSLLEESWHEGSGYQRRQLVAGSINYLI